MLSSATSAVAYVNYNDTYFFLKHQLFGLVLGVGVFWITSRIDYHIWKKYALGFLLISIGLLLLVFIPGLAATYGSSRSWINIFGFSLQPSEFVKISFLLYLAAWLEGRGWKIKETSESIVPFLSVLGIIGFLMVLQPDIGTLSIIVLISLIVYFIGGGNVKHIIIIFLVGAICVFGLTKLKPYQADRFYCFWDSSWSANDRCYQVNQALIAVGSGGVTGLGLGQSRQKFMYIPEVGNDAIFPIISEETGFIFGSILVLLFLFLFYRGYVIAKNAPDEFGKNLAIGIVSWITLQAIINIGGMINFMPITGVPLPFISYGGSAMLAALGATGILVNISRQMKG
jgi:cell division protein FtsW